MALDARGVGYTPAGPSDDHIGQVGGTTVVMTGAFNRPSDTTAYAIGDLIAPSTTPGVGNVTGVAASRLVGGTGRIIRLRVSTDQAAFSGTIRVHFFKTAVAPSVGDNGVLAGSVANYVNYYGSADVALTNQGLLSNGAKGFMAFVPAIAFDAEDTSRNVYFLLEARSAFTPAANQRFGVTIEADVD